MSQKLLPCPFCGSTDLEILPKDPSRDGNAWGAVQCVNVDCSTYDILKSHGVRVGDGQDVSDERGSDAYKSAAIAAWNRRTPAPEGEAVEEKLHPIFTPGPIYASPVVPVGNGEALPPISLDGPHKIGEHRQWLAKQLLDSRQDDAEAYSTVIYSPAMTDIWRDGVVPVGVSREEIARIIEPEFFSIGRAGPGYETHRASAFRKADAIMAALRPTDTGREA
jgi:hypothetical protein